MRAMMELNATDIKRVFAEHYILEEDEISVSPRAKVRIPADAALRTAVEKKPCDPCKPTQPECGECECAAEPEIEPEEPWEREAEIDRQEQRRKPMSRVERMFGKREDWNKGSASADSPRRKIKGFLILKCQNCGETTSYFQREETDTFKCYRCNGAMPIDRNALKPLYAKCPNCGNDEIRYFTNLTGQHIEVPCKKCKAPIDCELNGKGNAYVTVGSGGRT